MLTQERLKQVLHYNPTTGIFTWYRTAKQASINKDPKGYLKIRVDGILYQQHRIAWLYVYGEFPEGIVDHINHKPADNRIANLRVVTNAQNLQNQVRASSLNTSCGVLGCTYLAKKNLFKAQIMVAGKNFNLGLFKTVDEASAAYIMAKRKLHPTTIL